MELLDDPRFRPAAELPIAHPEGLSRPVDFISHQLACSQYAARFTDKMILCGLLARDDQDGQTFYRPLIKREALDEMLFWLRRQGTGWRGFLADLEDPRFCALAELFIDLHGGWSGALALMGRDVQLDLNTATR